MLPAPSANAKSPVSEVAAAVPSWNTVMPSIERDMLAKSNDEAGSAAAPPVAALAMSAKSNGEVGSAEATHGIAAMADPMPSPTARPLTRPTNFADFMGLPTLSAPRAAADRLRFGAVT